MKGFTTQGIAQFNAILKEGMGDLFQPHQVDLYQGTTISVDLYVGTRSANPADVTAGVDQTRQLVCIMDADDWDAKVNRKPGKGDIVWWDGKRHNINAASVSAPSGDRAFYKARLEG